MGPRNKLLLEMGRNGPASHFPEQQEETRSLQLYRLSASVCILEPPWLQHSCQVSGRPNDPSTHLLTVLLHPRYSGGQPARQCEQNIPKMRVEIGSGWDISCCQEVICIKHFLSAEKLLEKEWLFWVKSTILCLFAFVPWSPSWPNISPLVYHVLACCSGLLTSNISIYCGARSVLSTMYILLLFP